MSRPRWLRAVRYAQVEVDRLADLVIEALYDSSTPARRQRLVQEHEAANQLKRAVQQGQRSAVLAALRSSDGGSEGE